MCLLDVSTGLSRIGGLVAVPPAGPGVCRTCHDLIPVGYGRCRDCRGQPRCADAVLPISLCVEGGRLHAALRGYKDGSKLAARRRHAGDLAALVDDFLIRHEHCLAAAANTPSFDTVTVVPSSSPTTDELRPALRQLAGDLCRATRNRHLRLLAPTGAVATGRSFDRRRYLASCRARSAASALWQSVALSVAVLAVGRFVKSTHDTNGSRLNALPTWRSDRCAACAKVAGPR